MATTGRPRKTAVGADFAVVDGVGNGPDAVRASNEAVRVFGELRGRPLAEILELSIAVYAPLVELQ